MMGIGRRYLVTIGLLVCIAVGGGLYFAVHTPSQPVPLQFEEQVNVGKFTLVSPSRPAPEAEFASPDGTTRHLADYRDHWLLINLWATWCVPCIKEMPSLDRMQAKLGTGLDVLAVAEDRKGAEVVIPFVTTLAIKSVAIGLDPPGKFASVFKVQGLPTSFLIDPQGKIVAQLEGAAEWDQETTLQTLHALMTEPRN